MKVASNGLVRAWGSNLVGSVSDFDRALGGIHKPRGQQKIENRFEIGQKYWSKLFRKYKNPEILSTRFMNFPSIDMSSFLVGKGHEILVFPGYKIRA